MKTTTTQKLFPVIAIALAVSMLVSCKKDNDNKKTPVVPGKYDNGFFILNEDWYKNASGSVSFFDYAKGTITDSVFSKENTGKTFDPNTSELESGTIYNGKFYLLTKSGGPLVVADASTLKETGRIAAASTNDFRQFIGINNNTGLVSAGDGIYPINLSTVALGTKINSVSGEIGDMVKAGNYIFVLSANDGLDILNASDYSLAKNIPGMTVGFAVTPDGSVWVAGTTSLDKINPTNLAVTAVTVSFTVNSTWGAWHPGSITASTKDNTVFLANNEQYSGGTTIYRYTDGNSSSVSAPFITIASGKELYGKGLAYSATNNQLIVNTVESGYGTHYAVNDLDFYDVSSGALVKDIPFSGYFFPATYIFR